MRKEEIEDYMSWFNSLTQEHKVDLVEESMKDFFEIKWDYSPNAVCNGYKHLAYTNARQMGKSWVQEQLYKDYENDFDLSRYALWYHLTKSKDNQKETDLKTEGLTFMEAVEALEDGRCDCIELPSKFYVTVVNKSTVRAVTFTLAQIKSKDWKLVNPKLPTETRYYERWVNVFQDGSSLIHETESGASKYFDSPNLVKTIHVKEPYEVPVEPKEKFKIELDIEWSNRGSNGNVYPMQIRGWVDWDSLVGKKGTLTFVEY